MSVGSNQLSKQISWSSEVNQAVKKINVAHHIKSATSSAFDFVVFYNKLAGQVWSLGQALKPKVEISKLN